MTIRAQKRAVIYVRISLDHTGEGAGVARQEEACRKLCADRGWEVVEVIVDNSVSASSGKKRPGWERVVGLITAGAVEVVVGWQADRLYRSPRDLEDILDLSIKSGVTLATVTGEMDLATANGMLVARLLGAVARQEVQIKGERQKASHAQRVKSGKPWWTARPFGYERDGTIRESEAMELRRAYREVLAGASVFSVAARWNREGILTPRGNGWRSTNLRHVLMQPRNAAIATYLGAESGQSATWDAIVSEDIYRAVVRLLSNPDRHTGGDGRRKGLLTGVATCATCGSYVLQGQSKVNAAGGRYRVYTCREGRCVTIPADWLDAYVLREASMCLISASEDGEPEDAEEVASLQAEEVELAQRRTELVEDFSDGYIDRAAMRAGTARANARAAEIAERLAEIATRQVGVLDPAARNKLSDASAAPVKDSDVDELRRIIESMRIKVSLLPRGKGARSVDPETVQVTSPPSETPGPSRWRAEPREKRGA